MKKLNIKEMQIIAKERGGKCLSKTYVNSQTPLRWECGKGHKWKAMPSSVKRGSWCRKCYYTLRGISLRLNIEEMQEIAKQRDGKCLSDTYVNAHRKLLWQCAEGHQWKAPSNNVKTGSWCQVCAGNAKGTIKEMRRIAKKRGGKCLSDTYINAHTKLLWECKEGHKWEAIPNNVKIGSWCQVCAGKAKGTIEEMQEIAEGRCGKCLSDTYVNAHRKLLWECKEGHQWKGRPVDVKSGSWCPYCTRMARKGEKSNRNLSV